MHLLIKYLFVESFSDLEKPSGSVDYTGLFNVKHFLQMTLWETTKIVFTLEMLFLTRLHSLEPVDQPGSQNQHF